MSRQVRQSNTDIIVERRILAIVINNSKGFHFGQLEMGELIKQNLEGLIKETNFSSR